LFGSGQLLFVSELDGRLQLLHRRDNAMTIRIREANLREDQEILTGLTQTYLDAGADNNRFRWLYLENPFGPARAWIACRDQNEAVGMAAVFPRQMYREGKMVTGCVLGDLCISTKYRSVGPTLQLQRVCLSCARSGEFAVAYDFPSSTMSRVYEHLGILPMEKSVRLAKVLRMDVKIERILPLSVLSRPLAAAGNLALAVTARRSSHLPGLEVRLDDGPCSSEYSALTEKVSSSWGICTVRNAQYLNWRYKRHPRLKYEFLAARRHNELLAYCTFTTADRNATIAELFGSMDNQVLTSLLQELVGLLRRRGVASVSIPVLSGDPRTGLLRKLGFWAREAVPVMGFAGESTLSGSQLFLMHGDRES
jgi:hypothetical protein